MDILTTMKISPYHFQFLSLDTFLHLLLLLSLSVQTYIDILKTRREQKCTRKRKASESRTLISSSLIYSSSIDNAAAAVAVAARQLQHLHANHPNMTVEHWNTVLSLSQLHSRCRTVGRTCASCQHWLKVRIDDDGSVDASLTFRKRSTCANPCDQAWLV